MIGMMTKDISIFFRESSSLGKIGVSLTAVLVVSSACYVIKSLLSKIGLLNKLKEFIDKLKNKDKEVVKDGLPPSADILVEENPLEVVEEQAKAELDVIDTPSNDVNNRTQELKAPVSFTDKSAADLFVRGSGFPVNDPEFSAIINLLLQEEEGEVQKDCNHEDIYEIKKENPLTKPDNADIFTFVVKGQEFAVTRIIGNKGESLTEVEMKHHKEAQLFMSGYRRIKFSDKMVLIKRNINNNIVRMIVKKRPDMEASNKLKYEIATNAVKHKKLTKELIRLATKYMFTVPGDTDFYKNMLDRFNIVYKAFLSSGKINKTTFTAEDLVGEEFFTFTKNEKDKHIEVNVGSVQDMSNKSLAVVPSARAALINYSIVCAMFPKNVEYILGQIQEHHAQSSRDLGFLRALAKSIPTPKQEASSVAEHCKKYLFKVVKK